MSYIIQKHYHFHAAHRNEGLVDDKCFNLHGHTYHVEVYLQFEHNSGRGGESLLFAEIDKIICPVIEQWDHSLLLNLTDPIFAPAFNNTGFELKGLKINWFNCTTSAENLARKLFNHIQVRNLPITMLELAETTSSKVIYKP